MYINTLNEIHIETTFPSLRSLGDIYNRRAEMLAAVHQYPSEDPIYFFPEVILSDLDKRDQFGPAIMSMQQFDHWVIAGSAAVHALAIIITKQVPRWKNYDTDIFHLAYPGHFRFPYGRTDIVYNPAQTVEELLTNFDLPCCRAAFHPLVGTWISAQCISALIAGIYYLPQYTYSERSFAAMIRKYRHTDKIADPEAYLYKRFCQRVKKYEKRGFRPVWFPTEIVLPWIRNRFHYGEWKATE